MCKSIFVNLGGGGGGSVNTGVLQIAGGVALDSTLRFVEDQAGTDSALQLSTTQAAFYYGGSRGLKIADSGLSNYGGIWPFSVTPSLTNYAILTQENELFLGSGGSGIIYFTSGGNVNMNSSNSGLAIGTAFGAATARLQVKGDGTTASTNSLIIQNGGGTNLFRVRDDGSIFCEGGGGLSSTGIIGTAYGLFGGASYEPSASLVCGGTTTGFLPPRLTTTQRGNISSPATGLQLYNTTTNNIDIFDGTNYQSFGKETKITGSLEVNIASGKVINAMEVSSTMGLGFYDSPAIIQPTTAIGEATYVSSGGGGSQIRTDDTIGGYTMQQVVQALQSLGLLA